MTQLDIDYAAAVDHVLDNGVYREGRNGGFTSAFGVRLKADLRLGFPIITTRKIHYRPVFGELRAFLEGSESLATFKRYGCNYWEHNQREWKNPDKGCDWLGRIYGAQWREFWGFGGESVDQLARLMEGLKRDPYSRRHLLTTFNPAEIDVQCLPPCHVMTQFMLTQSRQLHQVVTMRSVDMCLGLPSDLVLYGLLQELVAKEIQATPATMTFMLGDAHVYENHESTWEEQSLRVPVDCIPMLDLAGTGLWAFDHEAPTLSHYVHREAIKYALN